MITRILCEAAVVSVLVYAVGTTPLLGQALLALAVIGLVGLVAWLTVNHLVLGGHAHFKAEPRQALKPGYEAKHYRLNLKIVVFEFVRHRKVKA